MKTSMKIFITAMVTAGLAGFGTYFLMINKAQADTDNLQSQIDVLNKKYIAALNDLATAKGAATTDTTATTTTGAAAASWKSYTSTNYGYSFTFPNDSWKNYTVKPVTPSDGSATKYIYFCVPTTDATWSDSCAKGTAGPISIGVYTTAQWNAIKDDGSPESNSKAAENSTYVFTFSTWQATPTDLADTNFDTKSILSSFKAN